MSTRALVIGAGVVGLSCAVRLAEAGFQVDVMSRDRSHHTTSAVAPALWFPRDVDPGTLSYQWAHESLAHFSELATATPTAGVRLGTGQVCTKTLGSALPSWARGFGPHVPFSAVPRPVPGYLGGWQLTVPVIHPLTYLAYLTDRLDAAGGVVTRMSLSHLPTRGLVINATGVAARALARDDSLRAVQGQMVLVKNPGITQWMLDLNESIGLPTYIVPHGDVVAVGATLRPDDWGTQPQPEHTALILEHAAAVDARLADAQVISALVGLRPARPQPRVELESNPEGHTVHCYGHSGLGWTTAWGCAGRVVALAQQVDPA